nr:MAG TPA: hypothetical protein [Caudoviricetes sp.]
MSFLFAILLTYYGYIKSNFTYPKQNASYFFSLLIILTYLLFKCKFTKLYLLTLS